MIKEYYVKYDTCMKQCSFLRCCFLLKQNQRQKMHLFWMKNSSEEMEVATPLRGSSKLPRVERMMEELEEKLWQLRQEAGSLKRQLHAESKDWKRSVSFFVNLMLAVCKSHGIFATENCLMYVNMIYIYQACHYMTHIMFITYMYIFLYLCILSIHIDICIYQAIQLFTTRICTIPPCFFLFFSEMYNESVSS